MKKMSLAVGVSVLTLGIALAGCSATKTEATKDETATETSAEASAAPSSSGLAVPDLPTGPNKTIADYVAENKIVESAVTKGEPGSPTFNFAMPPDWKAAGPRKPEWAYGAIIYDKAEDPADPPFITAIVSKLTGDVEASKVLEYAPGMLQNLPGYEQDGDVDKLKLGDFDAIQFQGSYLQENVRRYIAQETVVIPGKDGALFVLQLNADAPEGQQQAVLDAAKVLNADSTITF
jgi:hypothetical protein